jgi:hypothetical protein
MSVGRLGFGEFHAEAGKSLNNLGVGNRKQLLRIRVEQGAEGGFRRCCHSWAREHGQAGRTFAINEFTDSNPVEMGRSGGCLVSRFKDRYSLTQIFRKENRSSLQVKLNAQKRWIGTTQDGRIRILGQTWRYQEPD